jgi:hypothetical protein
LTKIHSADAGSIDKHHAQVTKVFHLLMDHHMCVDIDMCIFNATALPFQCFMISGTGIRMDTEKAKAIVDWRRPTTQQEVQQVSGLRNVY